MTTSAPETLNAPAQRSCPPHLDTSKPSPGKSEAFPVDKPWVKALTFHLSLIKNLRKEEGVGWLTSFLKELNGLSDPCTQRTQKGNELKEAILEPFSACFTILDSWITCPLPWELFYSQIKSLQKAFFSKITVRRKERRSRTAAWQLQVRILIRAKTHLAALATEGRNAPARLGDRIGFFCAKHRHLMMPRSPPQFDRLKLNGPYLLSP